MSHHRIAHKAATLMAAAAATAFLATTAMAEVPNRAVVDWTRSDEQINRGLFSTQGFMQVYVEPNPLVMETFKLTNPKGTHTRLETYIHKMEPENDDDDPEHFNWDGFHPDRMIRFITNRLAFEEVVDDLGMERLSLLCYNVDWLKSDDPDVEVADVDEWAEFAAAVVHTYNMEDDEYSPNLRYVQIWNEPNMPMFYSGNMESYFELFEAAAQRIHRDYPGVLVGGPTISHAWHTEPQEWMDAFLERSAKYADYISWHHYGPMGEGTDILIDDVVDRVGRFREIPGKEQGRAKITETDAWFVGWEKMQFLMERQFRFLQISDLLISVHHFCCMAYGESGNYTFGLVGRRGDIIPGNFWPYWLFRNLIGNEAHTLRQGPRQGDFFLAGSYHENETGSLLGNAMLMNNSGEPLSLDLELYFPPRDEGRLLVTEALQEDFQGVVNIQEVAAGAVRMTVPMNMAPGESYSVRLQDRGDRHFHFRDINNQEEPWVGLRASRSTLAFGDVVDLTVTVANTLPEPVSGTIEWNQLPEGWTIEPGEAGAEVSELAPGEIVSMPFTLHAGALLAEEIASPYAVLAGVSAENPVGSPYAIPLRLEFESPIHTIVLPQPIYAVAGERNSLTLQIENESDGRLTGGLRLELPGVLAEQRRDLWAYSVEAGERARFDRPVLVSEDATPGRHEGAVVLEFAGVETRIPFAVEVVQPFAEGNPVPVDLSGDLNFDPVAFRDNLDGYDKDIMGGFSYPGDFTPSGKVQRTRGIPILMPDLEAEGPTALIVEGQTVELPPGNYTGVVFISFGIDGKHHGEWVLHYADGSSDTVVSQVPEWCSPAPEGFARAFTAPHRYTPHGMALPATELWMGKWPADPERELTAVEFPSLRSAYILAITLLE